MRHPSPDITARTYRAELWRAVAGGVIESAVSTFLLLIALDAFRAGPNAKALLAVGGAVGLMLTPVTVALVARLRLPAARAASWLAATGAVAYAAAALRPTLGMLVGGSVIASTAGLALIPLLTQMYQENYPDRDRGRRFSTTMLVRIAVAAGFGWGGGRFLDGHLDRFPWLLGCFAAAYAVSAFCLTRVPSRPLTLEGGHHPWRAWRFVRDDRAFRITLISWMLMGIGNLMMLPLRVEYLGNPKYGLALSPAAITNLTSVVPNLSRFLMILVWGRLFDRMNFFVLRATLNAGFAVGILTFFTGTSMPSLVLAGIVLGVANAGGDVAWSLWVTKIAPPSRVADYMSIHTFLNGVRQLGAPFIAFHFIEHGSITGLGVFSGALIVASSLLLIPEMRGSRPARRPAGP